MVQTELLYGVAGLAGVVWVSMASSNNKYKVGNPSGLLAPSLAFILNMFSEFLADK